jgi:alginate O-acetyltransferase complex protein AlgJ
MALNAAGYLADRPHPKWFATALIAVFIAMLSTAFGGVFRAPREAPRLFEKRATAPLPAPPGTLSELRTYPARFELYFDDHFGLRDQLVRLDHFAKVIGFGVSPVSKVLIGTSGWLYFKGEDSKAFDRWYRGSDPFSDAEIAALRDELLRRNDFLASKGIPFLVAVVPEKYSMYPEFLPGWAARLTAQNALDGIASDLAKHPRLHFIDLRAALQAAKPTARLYYRTDSHWNFFGAGVGYSVMMDEVARLLPEIRVVPVRQPPYVAGVDYYSGDLAEMLGLPRLREDDIAPLAKVFAAQQSRCAQRDSAAETPGIEIYV